MNYKQIKYVVNNNIACITLNRPEKLNAWTQTMDRETRDAMFEAERDENVRVIILTGAGKGFCAGADMDELKTAQYNGAAGEDFDPPGIDSFREDYRQKYSYLLGIQKPIVAAINGATVGIGLVLALYCDIRFASKGAKFSTAFSKRGLIAEHGISWILSKIVGISNALDLLLSSRMIDAQEALGLSLVNKVFSPETFKKEVFDYASGLAENVSPRSMGIIKRQVYDAQFQTLAETCAQAYKELLLSLKSEDCREGIAHFLEKRAPQFSGK